MNRSLTCILTVILIASVLCGALAPAVRADFVVKTTTPSGVKPSSCYSAPKYPVPVFTFRPAGSSPGIVHWGPLFDGPPYSVEFHDLTTAPASGQIIASRYWNFGDGATSTEKDPVHTYASPGNYSVLLSVTTICGSEYTKKIPFYVNTYCTKPISGFTVDVSEGTAPLTVHVTDTSQLTPASVTTWRYSYSMDGTPFEELAVRHERNPVFIFDTPGSYSLSQTITKSCTEPSPSSGPTSQKGSLLLFNIKVNPPAYSAIPGGRISQTATTMTSAVPAYTTTAPAPQAPASDVTPAVPAPASASGTLPQGGTGAAAAPVSPGTGTLSVTTDPAGASVWVDEVKWGVSPAAIPGIAAGTHTLRLGKAGYLDLSVPVTVTEGKTAEYSLALEPVAGSSTGMLPLIVGAVVVLGLAGAGAYIFMKKKKAP